MADDTTPTQKGTIDLNLGQGENHDAYLRRLLTSGQFNDTQSAIEHYNQQVYGGPVRQAGDRGYGESPAAYLNGTGRDQVGMPGYYMVKQPDGSWQTIERQKSSARPTYAANLPSVQNPMATPVGNTQPQTSAPQSLSAQSLNTPVPAMPAQPQNSLNVNDMQRAINDRLQGQ